MRRRFLCLAAAVMLLAGLLCTTAYGAEAAVILDCPEQAAPETSFSASLVYEGATFGTASVDVSYDPDILEFRSCSGGEGFAEDGTAKVSLSGADGKVYLSCKLRFKALAEGETFITVTTSSLQDVDGNELVAETRSVKVLITPDAADESDSSMGGTDASDDGETGTDVSGEDGAEAAEEDEIYILRIAKKAAFRVLDGFAELFCQLSITEFLLFSMCVTVILLLLVLLAAEKRR